MSSRRAAGAPQHSYPDHGRTGLRLERSAQMRQREAQLTRRGWRGRWRRPRAQTVLCEQAGNVLGCGGRVDPAHGAIAARAVLEVGLEHVPQEPGPGPSRCGRGFVIAHLSRLVLPLRERQLELTSLSHIHRRTGSFGGVRARHHFGAELGVAREHPKVAKLMLPRRWHRRDQPREQVVGLQNDGSRPVLPHAPELELERLCRYITRPPVAQDRLTRRADALGNAATEHGHFVVSGRGQRVERERAAFVVWHVASRMYTPSKARQCRCTLSPCSELSHPANERRARRPSRQSEAAECTSAVVEMS